MSIINFVCDIISSPWLWLVAPLLLGWVWIPKTAADDVLCSHINELQTKKVDTDHSIFANYKARAWLDGVQEDIANNTWTKVGLNAETYDPGGHFDHATNYRFTAPVAGFYLICYEIRFGSVVADKKYDCRVYKNNADAVSNQAQHSSNTDNLGVSGADVVELAAADFIELWGRHTAGVGTIDFASGETTTYMTVHLLSI